MDNDRESYDSIEEDSDEDFDSYEDFFNDSERNFASHSSLVACPGQTNRMDFELISKDTLTDGKLSGILKVIIPKELPEGKIFLKVESIEYSTFESDSLRPPVCLETQLKELTQISLTSVFSKLLLRSLKTFKTAKVKKEKKENVDRKFKFKKMETIHQEKRVISRKQKETKSLEINRHLNLDFGSEKSNIVILKNVENNSPTAVHNDRDTHPLVKELLPAKVTLKHDFLAPQRVSKKVNASQGLKIPGGVGSNRSIIEDKGSEMGRNDNDNKSVALTNKRSSIQKYRKGKTINSGASTIAAEKEGFKKVLFTQEVPIFTFNSGVSKPTILFLPITIDMNNCVPESTNYSYRFKSVRKTKAKKPHSQYFKAKTLTKRIVNPREEGSFRRATKTPETQGFLIKKPSIKKVRFNEVQPAENKQEASQGSNRQILLFQKPKKGPVELEGQNPAILAGREGCNNKIRIKNKVCFFFVSGQSYRDSKKDLNILESIPSYFDLFYSKPCFFGVEKNIRVSEPFRSKRILAEYPDSPCYSSSEAPTQTDLTFTTKFLCCKSQNKTSVFASIDKNKLAKSESSIILAIEYQKILLKQFSVIDIILYCKTRRLRPAKNCPTIVQERSDQIVGDKWEEREMLAFHDSVPLKLSESISVDGHGAGKSLLFSHCIDLFSIREGLASLKTPRSEISFSLRVYLSGQIFFFDKLLLQERLYFGQPGREPQPAGPSQRAAQMESLHTMSYEEHKFPYAVLPFTEAVLGKESGSALRRAGNSAKKATTFKF